MLCAVCATGELPLPSIDATGTPYHRVPTYVGYEQTPHMVHSHTVHLPLGALRTMGTVCGHRLRVQRLPAHQAS